MSRSTLFRIGSFLLLVVIAIGLAYLFRQQLSWETLIEREQQLRAFYNEQPWLTYLAAMVLYVIVAGLSLPGGATILSLSYAWLFGFWIALPLVSAASTAGATLAFLLSRYFVGEWVRQRFAQQLASFDRAWEKEGAEYLFTLRLIPAFPFFAVNLLMGLTTIRVRTFWWISQVGMLPGTCLFLAAGASLPRLEQVAERGAQGILTPPLLAALAALGVAPLLIKKSWRWWTARRATRRKPASTE